MFKLQKHYKQRYSKDLTCNYFSCGALFQLEMALFSYLVIVNRKQLVVVIIYLLCTVTCWKNLGLKKITKVLLTALQELE